MAQFWVVGGEYKDTSFSKLAPGVQEQGYGPFASYADAYQTWFSHARATIDDATVRYRIVEEDQAQENTLTVQAPSRQTTPSRVVRSSRSSGVGTM